MHIEELVAEWQIADATLKAAKERFDKVTNELAQHMLVNEIKSDLAGRVAKVCAEARFLV